MLPMSMLLCLKRKQSIAGLFKKNTEQVSEWEIMKGSPIAKISTGFFPKVTFKAGHLCYSHNINNKKKHKGILKTAKEPSYYAIKYFYFCLTVT